MKKIVPANRKPFTGNSLNLRIRVSMVALAIMFTGYLCHSQVEYAIMGDQALMLAKENVNKDSINKALKSALSYFGKEIEFNPGSSHAYAGRAETKFMLGDYRGAINDCRKAMELDPANADACCTQGRIEAELGDYNLAIREFDKAIDINPHHSQVYLIYFYRGNAKSELGNDAAAILDYNKSIEIMPYSPAYFKRGISKLNLADRKGACLDWAKAKELGMAQAEEMLNKYCK